MAWSIDDFDISGQISVSSNPLGVGPAVPLTPAYNPILGLLHTSSVALFGDPVMYPAPIATVMIGKSANALLKATPALWVQGFGLPNDVQLGGPGPVGVTILATTVVGTGALTWNGIKLFNGAKSENGAQSELGAQAQTGAEARTGGKCDLGPRNTMGNTFGTTQTKNEVKDTVLEVLLNTKKPFDIPHPSKEGYRLRYVCLEGPDAEVYTRGTLRNHNVIELPDYWKDLVHEDTIGVTFTPVGHWQELFVEKIESGTKIIVKNNNDKPINCHYVVYGERKDTSKNIPEYEGTSPRDYPGDNNEYVMNL